MNEIGLSGEKMGCVFI